MSSVNSPLATPSTPNRLRRFACMMYEAVLLFGVVFLAGYLFDTLTQSRHALVLRHLRQAWLFVAIGLYFVMCWRQGGQTLPMKVWHIRLVDRHGRPPPLRYLLLRYLLMWPLVLLGAALVWTLSQATGWPAADLLIVAAPFAVFVWSWIDAEGQFLHDRILGTRLRHAPGQP